VEDYVRSIGQEIASLGTLDPRLLANGKFELRLKNQLKGYSRQDPPPERVKPIPMPLVPAAVQDAYTTPDPLLRATGDCGVIGLSFCCAPASMSRPPLTVIPLCSAFATLSSSSDTPATMQPPVILL
jgi:hypothetical protein